MCVCERERERESEREKESRVNKWGLGDKRGSVSIENGERELICEKRKRQAVINFKQLDYDTMLLAQAH